LRLRGIDNLNTIANELSLKDFDSAGSAVLKFLRNRFGFDLWMLTRLEGEDFIVLQSEDHGYDVKPGKVYRWADTFCVHMVNGDGPRIAPNSEMIPAYRTAPISLQYPIRAYVGVPLQNAEGGLFGTLCAIDRSPQPESLREEQPLLELLAALLSQILQSDLRAAEETRRIQHLEAAAHTDPLTSLFNRRAWDDLLAREEERCRRYGHPSAVLAIDLDALKVTNDSQGHAAGDALLQKAARVLRRSVRDIDIVARLGGDEFAIIGVECNHAAADALLKRVRDNLAAEGISASIGVCARVPDCNLALALEVADELMYTEKRRKQSVERV
jgi:diguanylate cyclase